MKNGNSPAILTAGESFPDGAAIDVLRDPGAPEKLNLALCHDGAIEIHPEAPYNARLYAPIRAGSEIWHGIPLPTRVAREETARELFSATHACLGQCLGQMDRCTTALTFGVFSSWMWRALPMAPLLSIFAVPGGSANLVLRMLSLLCRHSLRFTSLRRGDIPRLPMWLQPTLLLHEPDLRPAMRAILESSAQRGARFIGASDIFGIYGPKIIVSGKLDAESAFEADALRTELMPVVGQFPILDRQVERAIAEGFQARFLSYSLRNLGRVKVPSFDVSRFSPSIQDLARAFGAAIVDDEELQARILPLLRVQDEEIRSDLTLRCDAVVLEALLFFIHRGGLRVHTGEIARKVCEIYLGRRSDQQPSAEAVGWAIRRMGIASGRINRAGNGVELSAPTCRVIHRLAWSHRVRAMEDGVPDDKCGYCLELKSGITEVPTAGGR